MRSLLLFSTLLSCFTANAAAFSFSGNFNQDDDRQTFTVNLTAPGDLTLITFGYAGGVNAAATIIPQGGLDPWVTLFSGTGPSATYLSDNNDGGCGNVGTDSVTNACWDSYLQLTALPIGTYTVVITQAENGPNGITLGDGFAFDGQGNFTGPTHLGLPGSFIDAILDQRTSFWALDIITTGAASATQDGVATGTPGTGNLSFACRRPGCICLRPRP